MCMRASGASELRTFLHFHILKLPFLSIFCWYFRYFVGTNDMLVGLHVPTNFQMYRQNSLWWYQILFKDGFSKAYQPNYTVKEEMFLLSVTLRDYIIVIIQSFGCNHSYVYNLWEGGTHPRFWKVRAAAK